MKFTKGYSAFREKGKFNKYTMSCDNCDYFYQADGDEEELCQNSNVLAYDLVQTSHSVYCLYWKPVKPKHNNETAFKNGVSFGGRKKAVKKTRK